MNDESIDGPIELQPDRRSDSVPDSTLGQCDEQTHNNAAEEEPNHLICVDHAFSLTPLVQDDSAPRAVKWQQQLRRAAAQIEIETIQEAEKKCHDLTLRDLGHQYGIRHLAVLSLLTAVVLTLWKNFGLATGVISIAVALVLAVQHFVFDWERQHLATLARRKADATRKLSENAD